MEENNTETQDFNFYPPKPQLRKPETNRKDAISRSLVSMAIFVAVFYFFFSLDMRLILVVVAALIIHELGHFFTMEKFGYKDLKIFFVPLLGAYVSGENENISQKEKAIVYLAGPLPGILLGGIFLAAWWNTGTENFLLLASVFIYINAFNLLPVSPLDGGRFIETIFFHSNEIIQLVFVVISIVSIIAFSIYFEFYVFLLFGLLLIGKFYSRLEVMRIRKAIKKENFNTNSSFEELSDEEYWKMREVIIRKSPFYKRVPRGVFRYSEREPLIINHLSMVLQRVPEKDLSNLQKFFLMLLWSVFLCSPAGLYLLSFNPWQ